MLEQNLRQNIDDFVKIMLPLSQTDLERPWAWKDHDEEGVRFAFFVTIQELRHLTVTLESERKPITQAQRILGQYHAQYMDLGTAVLGLSAEDTERAPAAGEWPVRRVYGHILGADITFSAVVRYALEKHRAGAWTRDEMPDEDELRLIEMSAGEYKTLVRSPLSEMQAYHHNLHADILNEFSSITDEELDLPATFWEDTRFPIRHRLQRYEAHIVQHCVQIDKSLAAVGLEPGEPKRLIRYLYAALAQVEAALIGADDIPENCKEYAQAIQTRTTEIQNVLN